jgi:uncharacterized protein YndB with AHSA1/START domain
MSEAINPPEEHTVRIERLLPGPVELVWDYLTRDDLLATWLGEGHIANQPGGGVELRTRKSRSDVTATQLRGTVIRADPPRLLEFTWNAINDRSSANETSLKGTAIVTFELEPQGERVRLVLTHRRVTHLVHETPAITSMAGWNASLSKLAIHLEREQAELKNFLEAFGLLLDADEVGKILVMA